MILCTIISICGELKDLNLTGTLIERIYDPFLADVSDATTFFNFTTCKEASYTIQASIKLMGQTSESKRMNKIYTAFFRGFLYDYIKSATGNFLVSQLIMSGNQKIFSDIIDEIMPSLRILFAHNKPNILVDILSRCSQLNYEDEASIMKGLIKFLSETLQTPENEVEDKLVSYLCQFEQVPIDYRAEVSSYNKTALGCTILAELFKFKSKETIIQKFIEMEPTKLITLAKTSCGSRLIESFFNNEDITSGRKNIFFRNFKGHFNEMAEHTTAYFCILSAFKVVGIHNKKALCEELLEGMDKWTLFKHAPALIRGLSLDIFKLNSTQWTQLILRDQKKNKVLDSIFNSNDKKRKLPSDNTSHKKNKI